MRGRSFSTGDHNDEKLGNHDDNDDDHDEENLLKSNQNSVDD